VRTSLPPCIKNIKEKKELSTWGQNTVTYDI